MRIRTIKGSMRVLPTVCRYKNSIYNSGRKYWYSRCGNNLYTYSPVLDQYQIDIKPHGWIPLPGKPDET